MKTTPDQTQFAESDARLLAALEAGEPERQARYEERRYEQRIERFALAVFLKLIGASIDPHLILPGPDYKSLADEAVRAARELDDSLYPQSPQLPDYHP